MQFPIVSAFVVAVFILTGCEAWKVFIAAPNTLRLNVLETVSIFIDDSLKSVSKIRVSLQDFPGNKREFSISEVQVEAGKSRIVHVKVRPEDIPDLAFEDLKTLHYVTLVVTGPNNFSKRTNLLVSPDGGYYFLQTTKPIYKPGEDVQIRVIPLNERLRPSIEPFRLKIINPQGRIVEDVPSEDLEANANGRPYFPHKFRIPSYSLLGPWTITLQYGHKLSLNSTVTFTVEEYVLPTFTVKINSPEHVLETNNFISGSVVARHTYDKYVEGNAIFRFGVKDEVGNIVFIGSSQDKELIDGIANFNLETSYLKNDSRIGWFPKIEGCHLVVEASIIEWVTGKRETETDSTALFAKSPYKLSLKNSVMTFKPGTNTVVSVDASYAGSGKPAKNINVNIQVVDQNNQPLEIDEPALKTNENGYVDFRVSTTLDHQLLKVKVQTDDGIHPPRYQGSASVELKRYTSPTNSFVSISRKEKRLLKVGDRFADTVFAHPPESISDLYFMVLGRGSVFLMGKLEEGKIVERALNFRITSEMVPSIRVIVFASVNNQLIADSALVQVERTCSPEAEIEIEPKFPHKEPGREGKLEVKASPGTYVAVLAVDEAVYALKNNDRLTRQKVFDTMEDHDLGCGPGGGLNTEEVLANSGILILSNTYNSNNKQRNSYSCIERVRRKRQAVQHLLQHYTKPQKICCKVGLMRHVSNLTCEERADVILNHMEGKDENGCVPVFLECCIRKRNADQRKIQDDRAKGEKGGNDNVEPGFDDIDESSESTLTKRHDFREVFLFEDETIGVLNKTEIKASLPHSITTWVFQAFGVSPEHGMCVAEPKKVVAFQKLFLQVDLPYSVVQNEQIEIPATIYNYDDRKMNVRVYIYGVKGICSAAKPGEKSERINVEVPGNSAARVVFPAVPLEVGEFKVQVTAIAAQGGGDVIVKTLKVVPAGRVVVKDIPISLDPKNQQKRKRHVQTDTYTDSIDEEKGVQVSVINFPTDRDVVPGTEMCSVSAVGDSLGPVVQTAIGGLDKFLQVPTGCGEQTMMYLAPIIYTVKYLKVTGAMTDELEKKAYKFLREGYQRELTYRKNDGSYAAWTTRPSSTWLTAFVTKVFCQASRFINIDAEVLDSGLLWLARNQRVDGSFIDQHPVIHRNMMGGVGTGSVTLTAFVLITLQECIQELQQQQKQQQNLVILAATRAQTYLEQNLDPVTNPYDIALVAYALSLSESENVNVADAKLRRAVSYNPDLNQRYWLDSSRTRAIETSSYALLTQLKLRDLDYCVPIVNWMNSQRTFSGGFPSTQDTTIGLQALSAYATEVRNPALDLTCNMSITTDAHFKKTFSFQNDNAQILQQVELGKIDGQLLFKTSGKGVGMLNVQYRYNVLKAEDICKFDVNVTISKAEDGVKLPDPGLGQDIFDIMDSDIVEQLGIPLGGRVDIDDVNIKEENKAFIKERQKREADDNKEKNGGNKLKWNLKVCVKYLSGHDSDMGIIDVGLFTGFVPIKEDLKKIVIDKKTPVERYELSGKNVVFYLETVSHSKPVCLDFRITQDFFVGNTRPAIVKVYDYYKPEDICTRFYAPDKTSPIVRTVCESPVKCECAEGGCPKENAFEALLNLAEINRNDAEVQLLKTACTNYSFVWLVQPTKKEILNGYRYITFKVIRVVKEGIEERDTVETEERLFMSHDNCKTTDFDVKDKKIYFLMGQDGNRYRNVTTDKFWYRYTLDKNTAFHQWHQVPRYAVPRYRKLVAVFHAVGKILRAKGCHE